MVDRDERTRAVMSERRHRKPPGRSTPVELPTVEELAQALWDVAGDLGAMDLADYLGLEPERASELEDLCNRLVILTKRKQLGLRLKP